MYSDRHAIGYNFTLTFLQLTFYESSSMFSLHPFIESQIFQEQILTRLHSRKKWQNIKKGNEKKIGSIFDVVAI